MPSTWARSCGGAGQDAVFDVKHALVVVSQQLMPLEGGGQLFWHCASVVHVATHILIGWLRSAVTNSERSAGPFGGLPPLPQLAMKHSAPQTKIDLRAEKICPALFLDFTI
jgi:hypothetical protein